MTEINIDSREDWNSGEYDGTTGDSLDGNNEFEDDVRIGYPLGESQVNSSMPERDSIVLHYIFNEDNTSDGDVIQDYSGENNDGEMKGSATLSSGVFKGSGFDFDGDTGFIESNTDTPTGSFTVAAWFKMDNWQADTTQILGDRRTGDRSFEFRHSSGNNTFELGSSDFSTITVLQDFEEGKWYFLVITWDESAEQIDVYLDANVEGSSSTGNLDTVKDEIVISATHPDVSGGRKADATFDSVIVFDTAISESEVEQLYFNGHENDNFEGEYTSETFEPEEGEDVEVTELEITADIDTDASASVIVEALDGTDTVIDSETIQVNDGTDTYSVELDAAPKFRIVSEHKVSL